MTLDHCLALRLEFWAAWRDDHEHDIEAIDRRRFADSHPRPGRLSTPLS